MRSDGATAGWAAIDAAVATCLEEVAAAAPDAATAAAGEAYVMRIFTTCLTDAFLGHLMIENGLSRALPTRGGPNPDYRMVFAPLEPERRYRVEGWLNASERIGIGTYSFGPGGSADISAYTAIDAGSVDETGHFLLDVAADAAGPGTLQILPEARTIMARVLHRDPQGEPARLILHGRPEVRDLAVAQGNVEAALAQVARSMVGSIRTFLEWSAVTSAARNRFHAETPAMTQGVQGDPNTIYFLGSYDLAEDEWLEVVMPAGLTGYWSLHAYNHWCEALPGAGIGDNVAVPDEDGRVPIAIGPVHRGDAPNRIDTLGRRSGALICRFIGPASVATPETRVRSL